MKITKFLAVSALALVLFVAPLATNAQTIQDLMAQITRLQAQLAQLQGQSSPGMTPWCHTFNQNLGVGARGDEVYPNLRNALYYEGFQLDKEIFANNPVYDETMAAAVSKFQNKYRDEILTPNGLDAPTGYFGPSSRAKMNRLSGCNVKVPVPTPKTYKLIISSVDGLKDRYLPGEAVQLLIKGLENDGTTAEAGEGFHIQVSVYDSSRTKTYSGTNAVYDNTSGWWRVDFISPTDKSVSYDLEIILYCANSNCKSKYGQGYYDQAINSYRFDVGASDNSSKPDLVVKDLYTDVDPDNGYNEIVAKVCNEGEGATPSYLTPTGYFYTQFLLPNNITQHGSAYNSDHRHLGQNYSVQPRECFYERAYLSGWGIPDGRYNVTANADTHRTLVYNNRVEESKENNNTLTKNLYLTFNNASN